MQPILHVQYGDLPGWREQIKAVVNRLRRDWHSHLAVPARQECAGRVRDGAAHAGRAQI